MSLLPAEKFDLAGLLVAPPGVDKLITLIDRLAFWSVLTCVQVVTFWSVLTCVQVVTFDGGEFNFMAGEFNELTKLPKENWEAIRSTIKKTTGGSAEELILFTVDFFLTNTLDQR